MEVKTLVLFRSSANVYNTYRSSMYLVVSSAKLLIHTINCIYFTYTLLTDSPPQLLSKPLSNFKKLQFNKIACQGNVLFFPAKEISPQITLVKIYYSYHTHTHIYLYLWYGTHTYKSLCNFFHLIQL